MVPSTPTLHQMCLPAQEKRFLLNRIRFLEEALTRGLDRESGLEDSLIESNRNWSVMTNAYRATIRRLERNISRRTEVQRELMFSEEDDNTDIDSN